MHNNCQVVKGPIPAQSSVKKKKSLVNCKKQIFVPQNKFFFFFRLILNFKASAFSLFCAVVFPKRCEAC